MTDKNLGNGIENRDVVTAKEVIEKQGVVRSLAKAITGIVALVLVTGMVLTVSMQTAQAFNLDAGLKSLEKDVEEQKLKTKASTQRRIQAETKADQAEAKADQAEAKADQAEAKLIKAEAGLALIESEIKTLEAEYQRLLAKNKQSRANLERIRRLNKILDKYVN